MPENRRALAFLVSAVDDNGRALAADADGIVTRDLMPTSCARIVVDAGRIADRIDDRDLAMRAGDDVIITPDLWLWHADAFGDDDRLSVHIRADERFRALVPWSTGADGRFAVDAATFALKSDAAFGTFALDDVDAAGARFVVARLGGGAAPAHFDRWLATSARAVSNVLGRYPFARVNVIVVPTHVTRPIVVGFFSRGGGPTATFFVGEGAPDIDDDDLDATGRWALTHELAHPLLPPVKSSDAWLNEGLATFHQDLLARRAGLLKSDEDYWHELLRGLETGAARASEDRMTLDDASTTMHESGAYQHAYWAGVAVMLLAEIEARKSGASLDDVVRVARAQFRDDRPRSARDILDAVARGDDAKAAAAARALLRTYDEHAHEAFPSTERALSALGVTVDALGAVHLDDDAPLAAIRRAITQPSFPSTTATATTATATTAAATTATTGSTTQAEALH